MKKKFLKIIQNSSNGLETLFPDQLRTKMVDMKNNPEKNFSILEISLLGQFPIDFFTNFEPKFVYIFFLGIPKFGFLAFSKVQCIFCLKFSS